MSLPSPQQISLTAHPVFIILTSLQSGKLKIQYLVEWNFRVLLPEFHPNKEELTRKVFSERHLPLLRF